MALVNCVCVCVCTCAFSKFHRVQQPPHGQRIGISRPLSRKGHRVQQPQGGGGGRWLPNPMAFHLITVNYAIRPEYSSWEDGGEGVGVGE